tara:strand:- start:201 stop:584 length:384 start_codon:yes stop_codon:yes gene_type:complete
MDMWVRVRVMGSTEEVRVEHVRVGETRERTGREKLLELELELQEVEFDTQAQTIRARFLSCSIWTTRGSGAGGGADAPPFLSFVALPWLPIISSTPGRTSAALRPKLALSLPLVPTRRASRPWMLVE